MNDMQNMNNKKDMIRNAAEEHFSDLVQRSYHGESELDFQIYELGKELGYTEDFIDQCIQEGNVPIEEEDG